MTVNYHWRLQPGETLSLSASLAADIDPSASLESPEVAFYSLSGETATATGWTVTSVAANDSPITNADGSVTAIGQAVVFRVAIPADAALGDYVAKIEADTDDGDHPVTERRLVVDGVRVP